MSLNGLSFNKLSALVVQRHQFTNDLVRFYLEALGFGKVHTARDGEAAFHVFRRESPDFVLTDWDVGTIGGIELINKIRRDPLSPNRMVPIIMITGYNALPRVREALQAGINDYVVKPFDVKKLTESITRIINFPVDYIESEKYCGPARGNEGGTL